MEATIDTKKEQTTNAVFDQLSDDMKQKVKAVFDAIGFLAIRNQLAAINQLEKRFRFGIVPFHRGIHAEVSDHTQRLVLDALKNFSDDDILDILNAAGKVVAYSVSKVDEIEAAAGAIAEQIKRLPSSVRAIMRAVSEISEVQGHNVDFSMFEMFENSISDSEFTAEMTSPEMENLNKAYQLFRYIIEADEKGFAARSGKPPMAIPGRRDNNLSRDRE